MSIWASVSRSLINHPCTTHESLSVRYKVGEPLGFEPGSLAMNVRRMLGFLPIVLRTVATCNTHGVQLAPLGQWLRAIHPAPQSSMFRVATAELRLLRNISQQAFD
ncbi:hypothetical protein ACQP0C_15095 [Nocardia sp. CA-129566]|uniref:hypothetical protein n=1 Tax=Nocardia sp. CA-129566 TaxID=3239976 RepID=UPI003D976662